jgi:sugar lactone lactonase YvrE
MVLASELRSTSTVLASVALAADPLSPEPTQETLALMSISRIAAALLTLTFVAGCAGANTHGGFSPQSGGASQSGVRPMAAANPWEVYVSNYTANTVSVYSIGAGLQRTIKSGINGPMSLAFDAAGDLFVGNSNNTVTEYSEKTGSTPGQWTNKYQIGSITPTAIAVDGSGNLWIADGVKSTLTEYAPSGTNLQTITAGVSGPVAMTFGSGGVLLAVANAGNSSVTVYNTTSGNLQRNIKNGISGPTSLSYDGSGNLFVTNASADTVTAYAPETTSVALTIKQDIQDPQSLTFDNTNGFLWVANAGSGAVTSYAVAINPSSFAEKYDYFQSYFASAERVVAGPPNSEYVAALGANSLTGIPLYKMVNGILPSPSSQLSPTFVGTTFVTPVAMAVGP